MSGSSTLDLASEINEPLIGRKFDFYLYPISWQELVENVGFLAARQQLKTRLLFGLLQVFFGPCRLKRPQTFK